MSIEFLSIVIACIGVIISSAAFVFSISWWFFSRKLNKMEKKLQKITTILIKKHVLYPNGDKMLSGKDAIACIKKEYKCKDDLDAILKFLETKE